MPIPDYQTLMLPVLRLAAHGETSQSRCVEKLADEFELSEQERAEICGRPPRYFCGDSLTMRDRIPSVSLLNGLSPEDFHHQLSVFKSLCDGAMAGPPTRWRFSRRSTTGSPKGFDTDDFKDAKALLEELK